MASSSPRTPAPERPPPPVPVPVPVPVSSPPPPLETPPPPSPSSQAGEDYHTPPPSLNASPREEAGLPSDDGSGRGGGGGAAAKSPQLSPIRRLLPPPASPTGQNGQQEGGGGGAAAASPARPPLSLMTGFLRTPSQGSVATNKSASPSPSPTPPSPLTPAPAPPSPLTPAPAVNRSGQSTPRHRAEAGKPPPSPAAAAAIAVTHFDPKEEAVTSPLRLGKAAGLDHQQYQHRQQQQRQQHAASATAENGGAVPPDVAAVAAVGERRALSVTLRVATAALSLAAFSVIASDRTSGWAGDYFARHQQYRYALAVNVIVCVYSIVQSIGEIRRLISPTFIFRSMSSYYLSLFLDQVLAYLLMSASSAAASPNDLWVSRFGTDAFNRKISSALWLSFIAFLMLALNALISTANLFSMV